MTKKVGIYTRVSTLDQTIDNQLIELRDHCSKMGWEVVDLPGKSGGTFGILNVSGGPNERTETTRIRRT